jgi:predicted RNase H-like nuclease (RuvC/YqgF family)
LRPVSYHLKKDTLKNVQLGFIAQEVEPIIPEMVVKPTTSEDFYAMRYTELIPVLTKAIQEQQDIINDLKKTVSDMNAKNGRLEKGMENLESKLDAVLKRLNIEERNPATDGTEGASTSQLPQNSKKQN